MSRKVLGLSAVFALLAGLAMTGGNEAEAGFFGGHKKSCGCYEERGCFKKVKHKWFKKHRKHGCCEPACCAPVECGCCAPAHSCAPVAHSCCAPATACAPTCAPATCCQPAATCCAPAPSCGGSAAPHAVEDAPPAPPAEDAPAPAPSPEA